MENNDEYIITGYSAYYALIDGSNITEYFNATDIQEAAKLIHQEISGENRTNVRMISNPGAEIILLPVSSIVRCYIRTRYQEEDDGMGGRRRIKKQTL